MIKLRTPKESRTYGCCGVESINGRRIKVHRLRPHKFEGRYHLGQGSKPHAISCRDCRQIWWIKTEADFDLIGAAKWHLRDATALRDRLRDEASGWDGETEHSAGHSDGLSYAADLIDELLIQPLTPTT